MTDQQIPLDEALERVIDAARAHLAAVRAADGRVDDDDVWQAYVTLNNASFAYDELLLDAYGEVTPWDVEAIDPDSLDGRLGPGGEGAEPGDPHPLVVSVRQRRDYRVPSVAALLRVADTARRAVIGQPDGEEEEPAGAAGDEPIATVGDAVLELLQAGDGSLATLDVPELEPLDGVVTVTEVATPLDLSALAEDDGVAPFQPGPQDRLVGRLDEHAYLDLTGEDGEDGEPR